MVKLGRRDSITSNPVETKLGVGDYVVDITPHVMPSWRFTCAVIPISLLYTSSLLKSLQGFVDYGSSNLAIPIYLLIIEITRSTNIGLLWLWAFTTACRPTTVQSEPML